MPRRKRHQHEYPQWRVQQDKEEADFTPFAAAYEAATGLALGEDQGSEGTQDFTCLRSDGLTVGIEFTELRRSPDDAFRQSVLDRRYTMDVSDAVDELWRLIEQKSTKLQNYSTEYNIVLVQNCDAEFDRLCYFSEKISYEDLKSLGIDEIWLGDYCGIREGSHWSIALHGLYPEEIREFTDRDPRDAKPYG